VDAASPFPRFTGSADVSVRPAHAADAEAVARVQLVTWRTAYRDVLPAAVLDDWDEHAATESWRAAVVSPPTPAHGVLVALERDEVVGFAAYGPAELSAGEAPDPGGPTTEIATLLVEPRWGRRGHGSRLLSASVDLWREDGFDTAVAWAYERDAATRAFLTSAGWEPDGATRALDVDDMLVPQLRLHVSLAPPLS
jgi:GNAT superfamily N-acetyltransferase